MSHTQVLPAFGLVRFSCLTCGALAHQHWSETYAIWMKKDEIPLRYDLEKLTEFETEQSKLPEEKRAHEFWKIGEFRDLTAGKIFASKFKRDAYCYQIYNLDTSRCDSCDALAIWLNKKIAYPQRGPIGMANIDMPLPVKALFEEAGTVYSASPRASAALLRLALQVLLVELGQEGKDINKDINKLLETGLSPNLGRVMHSLRIIGNEAVHPGVISVNDDPSIAAAMFKLLNEIVEQLISRPREQQELWEMLPESKRAPVEAKLKPKSGN